MNRSAFFMLLLAVASVFHDTQAARAGQRPNVIIVLSDDQGYGDFSCHGNPVLRTPNLDKLHDQSIRLTDFHVAPMCTPTRGQLMTGLDALRNGATSVCAGRCYMRRGIPTMADVFAADGYQTALFGKWHLGDNYPNLPQNRGFGEVVHLLGWGITSIGDQWLNDYFDGQFRHNGVLTRYPGYCTDVWFNLSIDWMQKKQRAGEPFFLYLPTNAPHGPNWVEDKYKQPYLKRGPAGFFGMIANLDENMGRLERFLSDSGLRDNTIVIYMHDNGGTAGVKLFNAGMRGRKTQYYEGGHRAACFVRWPAGKLRPAGDVDALTQIQDLLPTLMDFCQLRAMTPPRLDGTSLAGLLKGGADPAPDRTLVVQYGQEPKKFDSAVLWKKWRLVHGRELYDVGRDPGQEHDVAAQHSDVVGRMRAHYESWWSEIEPTLNDFSPITIGSNHENPARLTAADWANVYCDNMPDVRKGVARNGVWHILPERAGTYEIALRRWPVEANAALAMPVPEFKGVDGGLPAGKALSVARARLKLGDFDQTVPVGTNDTAARFTARIDSTSPLEMQSWLYDEQGKELCGAYFAYVRRLE